jgi:hypothetical protein
LATGKDHCRHSDHGQVWDFVFQGLLVVAVNLCAIFAFGVRPTGRF